MVWRYAARSPVASCGDSTRPSDVSGLFAQVYCLNWNTVRRNVFLSGSWDDSIKLWDLQSPGSLATFSGHTYCVYAAVWCACPGSPVSALPRAGRHCCSVLECVLPCSQAVSRLQLL